MTASAGIDAKVVAMLFVGLADLGPRHSIIASRLVELGAVRGHIGSPPAWDVQKQAIVVLDGTARSDGRHWPGLHLVIGAHTVGGSNDWADARLDVNGSRAATIAEIDALWTDRIVPFEANLRKGQRAPRRQQPVLADPNPSWSGQASGLIERLRYSAVEQFIQADHIGSTSVPGLPAKDLIDIQIVVADLASAARMAETARRAGFVHVPGQWFGTDRYGVDYPEEVVVDADPGRSVNVNIRPVTAPIWRETLLFRDWLRSHPQERETYAAMKHRLARRQGRDVNEYSVDKMPWISAALARAESWATCTGWSPCRAAEWRPSN